jgi:hypothetical protein
VGSSSFSISVAREGYFLVTGAGVLTIEAARFVRAEIDRIGELHPHIDRGLYDGTHVEGFEPGQAIEWIRWSRSRARPARAVAFVTRIPAALAAASTLRFMLPRLRFGAFPTRDAAIAFLLTANDVEPRRPSGR